MKFLSLFLLPGCFQDLAEQQQVKPAPDLLLVAQGPEIPPKPLSFPQQKQAASPKVQSPAQKPAAAQVQAKAPSGIKRLDAYRLKVDEIFVDRLERKLEIPCKLNMEEGILEYFAVSSQGKLHESVLECMIRPRRLHLAFLLIGMEVAKLQIDPKHIKPPQILRDGGAVKLFVRWQDQQGAQQRCPAEEWLYNRKEDTSPPVGEWHFLGSRFQDGRYSADQEGSLIGLVPDSSVLLESGSFQGNPYQGADLGFEVFKARTPPRGTPVTLIAELIRTVGPEHAPAPAPKAKAAPKAAIPVPPAPKDPPAPKAAIPVPPAPKDPPL